MFSRGEDAWHALEPWSANQQAAISNLYDGVLDLWIVDNSSALSGRSASGVSTSSISEEHGLLTTTVVYPSDTPHDQRLRWAPAFHLMILRFALGI